MLITYHIISGGNGCDIDGEVEVPDNASEAQIRDTVIEDMWNWIELSWWEK